MIPPEQISPAVKAGPAFEIRGALAQNVGGDHIRLWTENLSVAIFTEGAASQAEAAQSN